MKFHVIPFLLIMFSLNSSPLAQSPAAPAPPTVIVFGDSITEGNMLPADQRSKKWVALVEKQSQGRLQMVNEGKGGRPTDSVNEFKAMLTRHPRADMLVIALGTNDSRNIKEDCVPNAVKNIEAMVDLARAAYGKIPVLLVGPPNIRKDALGPSKPIADQRNAKLRELGAAFETLAKQSGCNFTSLYGVIPDTSLSKDGVHPDAAGNEAIVKVILPRILPVGK